MANIYLRVPTYVAQYFRGRVAPQPPLTEFEPVEFSMFQEEYAMMYSWLVFVAEKDMEHTVCFSERMWKNMLAGRLPQGGKVQLRREPTDWLTMDEINFLTGTKRNRKTDGFDYLCIAAPRVITIGADFKQVTGSFTLHFNTANALVKQLRREFLRVFLSWICPEMFVCDRKGIRRDVVTCIDHFFYHFNMCLGTNATDRDSMRRMSRRWLEEARMLPDVIEDEDVLMIYDKEWEKRGMNIEEMITSVKRSVNND